MSRGNAGPNNPANRGVGGHIKEGLKNVPKMYGALFNAKGPQGQKLGVKTTVTANARTVLTGKSDPNLDRKSPPAMRAKMAVAGAASVTPLGPIAAIGLGINKSVQDKKAALKTQNTAALKAGGAKGSAQVGAKATAAKKPVPDGKDPRVKALQQQAAAKKAADLKKTLNNAMPGLNMK